MKDYLKTEKSGMSGDFLNKKKKIIINPKE